MRDSTDPVASETSTVTDEGDEIVVRNSAVRLADAAGFDRTGQEELGIVARELATNVVEHAGEGEITVEHVADDGREGIRIESTDAGPGIADAEAAFADDVSTAGGLGRGLGAVNRLSDRVTVGTPAETSRGARVVAERWVRDSTEPTEPVPLSFGFASRPMHSGHPNGDSFVLKRWDDSALAGVIDGLGHGQGAATASAAARQYVERHYDQPIEALFEGTERACKGTRGVVMALVRFDFDASTLTFGSVGDIGYKIYGPENPGLVARRGVLGSNSPSPRVTTVDWEPSHRLVLHSDGVSTRWNWHELGSVTEEPATDVARYILREFGKDDDATVLVVRDSV
jgi:anti-sigma regulatory factor (Ser/Thr protein kinase)